MDLRQLEYFLAVTDCAAFSRAALKLSVAQPVLSRRIKALEDEFGAKLYHRTGRGVTLTEAGKMVEKYARATMEATANTQKEINSLGLSPTGTVRIGMPPSVVSVLAAPIVASFSQQYPKVLAVGALAYQVTGEKSGSPLTPLEAKFDLKYCVALALAGRPLSASDFADPLASEPGIALAVERMEATSSPALGYASATIEAVFQDGRRQRSEIAVAKGHPGNPMTWDDMRAKFEGLVEPVAGSSTRDVFEGLKDFGGESGGGLKTIRMLSAALND